LEVIAAYEALYGTATKEDYQAAEEAIKDEMGV